MKKNSTPEERGFESLYIHVPFCRHKCAYCAFYSLTEKVAGRRNVFCRKIGEQLADHSSRLQELKSVFIGGGTPTSLTCRHLDRLFRMLRTYCRRQAECEFTVECNPESLNPAKINLFARAGVNRVSIGIQSFFPELRSVLGRKGSLAKIDNLIQCLLDHGIGNIGFDLIYGIPGQTLEKWRADLEGALALGISHLSTYELTLEEGARLTSENQAAGPAPELAVAMWRLAGRVCRQRGLPRYEVSNFGLPCRHNDAIWHGTTYLGVGPAACSFDGRRRWTNPSSLQAWLGGGAPEMDELSRAARAAEILAFGMRTRRGWNMTEFKARTGFDAWHLRPAQLTALADEGLLVIKPTAIRPTEKGMLFADHIAASLL